MSEENRQTPNAYFLTLTIDDKSYKQISKKYKLKDDNDIATKTIRLCLERVRKLTGKSVKHWFITELGHEKTERLHLHGIVWGLGNGSMRRLLRVQETKTKTMGSKNVRRKQTNTKRLFSNTDNR